VRIVPRFVAAQVLSADMLDLLGYNDTTVSVDLPSQGATVVVEATTSGTRVILDGSCIRGGDQQAVVAQSMLTGTFAIRGGIGSTHDSQDRESRNCSGGYVPCMLRDSVRTTTQGYGGLQPNHGAAGAGRGDYHLLFSLYETGEDRCVGLLDGLERDPESA
jgi:hypothetical protein